MKVGLNLQTGLQQSLTPQQIQYLKMLQLPLLQLEQHVRVELENNPMLEEASEHEVTPEEADRVTGDSEGSAESTAYASPAPEVSMLRPEGQASDEHPQTSLDEHEFDMSEALEFQKLLLGEDASAAGGESGVSDDDDEDYRFQIGTVQTLEEDLLEQLRFLPMSSEEHEFGQYIIGSIDDDGYLRRPLDELLEETNNQFSEHNLAVHQIERGVRVTLYQRDLIEGIDRLALPLTMQQAEGVLKRVQSLDPPGIASRSVQECLVAQLRAVERPNAAQKLALMVLTKAYEPFAMKHYHVIEKQLDVTESYLREALDVIRHLTPRPGGGTITAEMNTVVPDFTVETTEDESDFLITVNDSRLPTLRVSTAYERLKKEARYLKFNRETREFLRKKYEDAKFLMQALRQRKNTMLRIMTAIVGLQQEFFRKGPEHLKPLIYRDVSEITGLDISTVCRIVNAKYVMTSFGTFELKYFFSESLTTDDGEEVSTRVIKQKIKELIDSESKSKPLSDEKICKDLKKLGFNVARRTVAKYREQLRIPVARLRKEL
ncbi:MAG: RNA polymerase factor sigma-54 [Candidatus Kapabacteria bacterium]|nr:RNA polymerase factor sigma-54 [Candidatus Kapabacteria bacterium]